MEMLIQTLLSLISACFSAFLTFFLYKAKQKEAKKEAEHKAERARAEAAQAKRDAEYRALKNGVQSLLRDRILNACHEHERDGWVEAHAMESLSLMYKAYHALGGNGIVTMMYERVQKLPHISPIARGR